MLYLLSYRCSDIDEGFESSSDNSSWCSIVWKSYFQVLLFALEIDFPASGVVFFFSTDSFPIDFRFSI